MKQIPILLSGAHLHPTAALVKELFGDAELTVKRHLTLKGHWVYRERVLISGPSGREVSVAILGPYRDETQLEMNPSQYRALSMSPPFRQSGQLDGTPGFWVKGPAGRRWVPRGAILAATHIHLPESWGLKAKRVLARAAGFDGRWTWYGEVPVKVGDYEQGEIHFDSEIGGNLFGPEKLAWIRC
jgi:propanediol utilization protein